MPVTEKQVAARLEGLRVLVISPPPPGLCPLSVRQEGS